MAALDRVAMALLAAWCVWVVVATGFADRPVWLALPYLVPPLVALAGVTVGRLVGRFARDQPDVVAIALAAIAWVFVLGWVITPIPGKLPTRYPNANAAVGVQLIALVGLAWAARAARQPARVGRRTLLALVAAGLGAALTIVFNDSVAGSALAVPVLLITVACAWSRRGLPRWLAVTLGAATLAAGAFGQVSLARMSTWPAEAYRALSMVRKQLWSEALSLWGRHRLTGGGAGSFSETNALSADSDLARAHSSTLQVASEFGWIGLALFATLILLGLLFAAHGHPATVTIATAAWVALALHSYIDHLYEFPAVMFTATVVLGWASAVHHSGEPRRLDRQEPQETL